MGYSAKNYLTQGGDELVIGGKLTVLPEAEITGLSGGGGASYTLPTASASALGGVKAAAKGSGDTVPCKVGTDGKLYVPTYPTLPENATAATPGLVKMAAAVADAGEDVSDVESMKQAFNGLLASLRTAGLLAGS